MQETKLLCRSDIANEEKWNIDPLFLSVADWERAFNQLKKSSAPPFFISLDQFKGKLAQGVLVLKAALEYILGTERELERLYTYAHLRHDEDIADEGAKGLYERITTLMSEFSQEKAFFEPELIALPETMQKEYLQSAELRPYRFLLEKIFRMRPHTLSADKELLLAMAQKPLSVSQKAFSALNNADFKFSDVKDGEGESRPLTHGLYGVYLHDSDRELRKNAFLSMHGKFSEYENTLAELLSGEVECAKFSSKARNFSSSLEAALFPWAVPSSVYRNLIDTVRKNLSSLHRYVKMRKEMMGVSELHFYDLYVPLGKSVNWQISKEQAIDWVIESVAPLGKEYQSELEKGLKKDRWVDWQESKNKRSGAYSSGCYDSFPYILMNWRGTLRDLFTLAHEAGHSMHSFLSKAHLPYHDYRYPIFVAEIASTLNEELLMVSLLKKRTKREERFALINEKIEDIRATLFRQTLFAEMELKLHTLLEEGVPLTPSLIKENYLKLYRDYFGSELLVDDLVAIEWARIPHFYYNFYVYQYATGISAALALSEKVQRGESEKYLAFLKAGGSAYPLDLLKMAGVDMSQPQPIESAIRTFDGLLDELRSLAD